MRRHLGRTSVDGGRGVETLHGDTWLAYLATEVEGPKVCAETLGSRRDLLLLRCLTLSISLPGVPSGSLCGLAHTLGAPRTTSKGLRLATKLPLPKCKIRRTFVSTGSRSFCRIAVTFLHSHEKSLPSLRSGDGRR